MTEQELLIKRLTKFRQGRKGVLAFEVEQCWPELWGRTPQGSKDFYAKSEICADKLNEKTQDWDSAYVRGVLRDSGPTQFMSQLRNAQSQVFEDGQMDLSYVYNYAYYIQQNGKLMDESHMQALARDLNGGFRERARENYKKERMILKKPYTDSAMLDSDKYRAGKSWAGHGREYDTLYRLAETCVDFFGETFEECDVYTNPMIDVTHGADGIAVFKDRVSIIRVCLKGELGKANYERKKKKEIEGFDNFWIAANPFDTADGGPYGVSVVNNSIMDKLVRGVRGNTHDRVYCLNTYLNALKKR